MRIGIAALAAALLVATAPALAGPMVEHLVMQPYPATAPWKLIADKNALQGFYHEQIPADQTVDSFSDILTDQDFPNLRGYDPAAYLKTVFAGFPNACSGVRVAGPQVMKEGGYAVAYGQVYCGQQNGKPFGVMDFYKVISGNGALYVISREFHTPVSSNGALLSFPPGHEADAKALLAAQRVGDQYLANQVYVCGGTSTDARCK
jgi:hypothetical protein